MRIVLSSVEVFPSVLATIDSHIYHKGKFTSQDSDKSFESASEHGTLSTGDQLKEKGGRRPMYCNSVFDMKKKGIYQTGRKTHEMPNPV